MERVEERQHRTSIIADRNPPITWPFPLSRAATPAHDPTVLMAIYIGGGAGVVSVGWERAFWGWQGEQQDGGAGGAHAVG